MKIEFLFTSLHSITEVNGYIKATPALPALKRLYVITNAARKVPKEALKNPPDEGIKFSEKEIIPERSVYVGVAQNLKARFSERLKFCRDFGISQKQLDNFKIATVQVWVDNKACPPDKNGRSTAPKNNKTDQSKKIDVEHLLIRHYCNRKTIDDQKCPPPAIKVRNISKTEYFYLEGNQQIEYRILIADSFPEPPNPNENITNKEDINQASSILSATTSLLFEKFTTARSIEDVKFNNIEYCL